MSSCLRHILICSVALAGSLASDRAVAAFLPPELDASVSGPAEPGDTPREAPRPERVDAVANVGASMTGTAIGSTGGGSGQVLCGFEAFATDTLQLVTRLALGLQRVAPCKGFALELLRPPSRQS